MVERSGRGSRLSAEDLLVRSEGQLAGLEGQFIVTARGHLGNNGKGGEGGVNQGVAGQYIEIEIKSPSHKLNLQSDEVRPINGYCTSTGMIRYQAREVSGHATYHRRDWRRGRNKVVYQCRVQ